MPTVPVWPVTRLLASIQELLDSEPGLRDVWIEGEVSNHTTSGAGHQYFSLKDAQARIDCVAFKRDWRPVAISNGDAVVAHGRVAIYQQRGQLQVIVDVVQARGVGELALRFEELRTRLEAAGMFDPSRKRPLPRLPRRIGVVTSASGAVWHDIQQVLGRRYPLAELILAPAQVQGPDAARTIVAGIEALNRPALAIDTIIVARGGGSLEELWPFNEESVALAIFASRVPIISAVGHETDVSIADYVADIRAPTPSAAAELVAPSVTELRSLVIQRRRSLGNALRQEMVRQRHLVAQHRAEVRRCLPPFPSLRQRVDQLAAGMRRCLDHERTVQRGAVAALGQNLEHLNPLATLHRGFAVVSDADTGAVLRSAGVASQRARLRIGMIDGEFDASAKPLAASRIARGRRPASIFQPSMPGMDEPRDAASA